MKLLIIENEIKEVDTTFEAANYLYFKNELIFEYIDSSQKIKPFTSILDYGLIIIDIVLAPNSEKDGFGLIRDIISIYPDLVHKIIILTGDSKIKEKLIEKKLPLFPIIEKPIGIEQIKEIISVFFNK